MLHSVVLAMTLIVSLIPWQAAAQDATSLRGGVVKIMSTDREGMHRTGTGFVVKVEGKSVYIVTAEHLGVMFFPATGCSRILRSP